MISVDQEALSELLFLKFYMNGLLQINTVLD